MKFLLDTDTCIHAMSGQYPSVGRRLAECEPGEVGLSTISFSEILLGANRGMAPPADVLNAFLLQMELLPYDAAAADAYARLPFKRGSFDRLIAAHALSLGATVITNNAADFADLPGLCIENWTLPL